ncbi:MAG: hypothetical protein R3F54_02640 [Alphaproteobacteria bacterium]
MRLPLTLITATALLLLLVSITLGRGDAASEAVDQANRLYQEGDFAGAFRIYGETESLRPDAAAISYNQGNVLTRTYKLEAAVDRYTAAAETEDAELQSRVQYNLGVVKYRQALEAMQTFQDAMSDTRAAIRHWRKSLELRPDQEDARYNLELAYRLAAAIDAQRVQAQRNAETRNQKTSDNRGQAFEDEEERASNDLSERDAQPTASTNAEAGQGQSGSQAAAPTQQMSQVQEAGQQDDLTPDAAEELLEIMRERALAAQNQRQAEQQVRIRASRQGKYW